MEKVNLSVVEVITNGAKIGIKNFPSLIVASILYIFTIWIPYINVGTTIAMQTLPGRLAKGEIISPTFIFDSKYRDDFSAFFLLSAFIGMTIWVGLFFMIIPGIVIALSLSFATIILIEDKVSPTEAMKLSNNATKGYKWTIFLTHLAFFVVFNIGYLIICSIVIAIGSSLIGIILFALYFSLLIPFTLGVTSIFYNELYVKRKSSNTATYDAVK